MSDFNLEEGFSQMRKIRDRYLLTVITGLLGLVGVTMLDTLSNKLGFSERSYRQTAAGLFVPSRLGVRSKKGQLLGFMMNGVASIVGAGLLSSLITKTGRDLYALKGIVSGITHGALLMLLQSALPWNKVKPKDARSNLSYVGTNAIYGLICGTAIAKLGDDSLFDAEPANDQIKPTLKTSEEVFREYDRFPESNPPSIEPTFH